MSIQPLYNDSINPSKTCSSSSGDGSSEGKDSKTIYNIFQSSGYRSYCFPRQSNIMIMTIFPVVNKTCTCGANQYFQTIHVNTSGITLTSEKYNEFYVIKDILCIRAAGDLFFDTKLYCMPYERSILQIYCRYRFGIGCDKLLCQKLS